MSQVIGKNTRLRNSVERFRTLTIQNKPIAGAASEGTNNTLKEPR